MKVKTKENKLTKFGKTMEKIRLYTLKPII